MAALNFTLADIHNSEERKSETETKESKDGDKTENEQKSRRDGLSTILKIAGGIAAVWMGKKLLDSIGGVALAVRKPKKAYLYEARARLMESVKGDL